ncbi:MAG: carboxypeptidase-like regulatory domain-containing protein [Chloroflexota bacterium]
MRRSRLPVARSVRLFMLAIAVVSLLSADLSRAMLAFAKDIDVVGIVDCGLTSGKRCDIGDTLVLVTDAITGEQAPVTIDVSWIKDKLPALDQDDEITLSVEILPSGKIQALSVISARKRSGTLNPGQVTGTSQQSRRNRDRQEDDGVDNTYRPAPGNLAGTVRSLISGAPIPGATVRVNGLTGTTDANGAFLIQGIDVGAYQATASAPGFTSQTLPVTIGAGTTAQVAFLLGTAFPDITFTLVWGAQPVDLDAHLSGPSGGGRFHASFLNPNPVPYASLTVQDDDGFGPEQIVIRRDPVTQLFVPGDYHFWVHNFTGTPGFNVSQGRVVVNKDAQLLGVFDASGASGDPNLPLWYVVNLQIDAAGNVTVGTVQQFTNGDLFTVLVKPPYGPKPPRR